MRPVIGECKVYAYLDDLLINSDNIEQHIVDLERVLSLLDRHHVKLDPAKCDFAKSSITWCGYIISNGLIRPDPSRLQTLSSIVPPSANVVIKKPWQKIFGLLGYYRKFISGYCHKEAEIKSIRSEYLQKRITLKIANAKINDIVQSCVAAIKSEALTVPSPDTVLHLKTDASNLAAGWVLEDSQRRPILYGGKSWSVTEKEYSTFEQEMLSTLLSIDKCKDWIQRAKRVVIHTDNTSCLLNYAGTTRNISARAIRFILRIQARLGPNVEYKHISSLKNVVADYISRVEEDIQKHPKYTANMIQTPKTGENTLLQLSESVEITDSCDCDICSNESIHVVTRASKKYADVSEKVRQMHVLTHAGQNKLILLCKEQNISHPDLRDIVRNIVINCPFCMTEKKLLANKVLGITDTPKREMHTVCCDHTYMPARSKNGMKYMVTLIDPFSKYLTGVTVENLTMKRFCQILSQYLIQYPQIREVRFDNAFNSTIVRETCNIHNVTPILNASFNSRENCVERAHRTLKDKILAFSAQNNLAADEWHLAVSDSLNAINTTPHSSTGFSPFEVIFNHKASLYLYDDNTTASKRKADQRSQIFERLISLKRSQFNRSRSHPKPIPMLEPDQTIIVRYGPRHPKIFAKVIRDHGMTLTVRRFDIHDPAKRQNQHGVIKVAKRHVYLPNPNSFEMKNVSYMTAAV